MTDKTTRIIDIAKMARVSIGTVDRVLHNRGKVSDDKKERIEKILKELNYKPNEVARFLASKRNYKLAALIPSSSDGDYWNIIQGGIDKATEELNKFNLSLEYFHFDQYSQSSYQQKAEQILQQEFDGVLISALYEESAAKLSNQLESKDIPYIYIDSNISEQNNLAYFGGNSFLSGTIAAKLLIKEIGTGGNIILTHVMYKRDEVSAQMKTREFGFLDYLSQTNFSGQIYDIELTPNSQSENIEKLKQILMESSKPIGGIVFNSRIYQLISLLDKLDTSLTNKMRLIGYDAIIRNAEYLKQDRIMYLISQHPELQGYGSLKALGNYVVFKQTPDKMNYMPIDILIKENVDYNKNYKL
ncbi:MAG: hypothetical protein RL662_1578 [Bacteroidota bacterium]|jgi:LacI family transcriptional regulator